MHGFLLAGLMAAGVPAASTAVEPGPEFTHHDWMLACDNTRTCRAAGYQDEASEPVSVLLTREAGPDTVVTGRVLLGHYDATDLPQLLWMRIDGRQFRLGTYDPEEGKAELEGPHVAELLAALTRDSQILFLGDGQDRQWQLSDRGAAAVLLKMDDVQGRIGTPGALVRRGRRSEDSVLPPLPAPRIHRAPLAEPRPGDARLAADPALLAALVETTLGEPDDCYRLTGEDEAELAVSRLSGDTLLVSALCWRAAYNEGYGYWLVDGQPPYRPRLVTTAAEGHQEGVIFASQKGRGLGDCWWHASWIWDGREFVHASESSSGLCRLVVPGGAWHMPRLVTRDSAD